MYSTKGKLCHCQRFLHFVSSLHKIQNIGQTLTSIATNAKAPSPRKKNNHWQEPDEQKENSGQAAKETAQAAGTSAKSKRPNCPMRFCVYVFVVVVVVVLFDDLLHLALLPLVQCSYNPPRHMHVTIAQGTSRHMRKANIQISLRIRSLSCPREELLDHWLPIERPSKDY